MTTHAAAAASVPPTAPRRASGPGRIALQDVAQRATTACNFFSPKLRTILGHVSVIMSRVLPTDPCKPPGSRHGANWNAACPGGSWH